MRSADSPVTNDRGVSRLRIGISLIHADDLRPRRASFSLAMTTKWMLPSEQGNVVGALKGNFAAQYSACMNLVLTLTRYPCGYNVIV